MTYWILPWNKDVFDLPHCLRDFGFVEWRQKNKLAVGDIVFLYCSYPLRQIKYMMVVTKIDISSNDTVNGEYLHGYEYNLKPTDFYARFELIAEGSNINDSLSLGSLRKLGICSNIQGGIRVPDNIVPYLINSFDVVFDDLSQTYIEGMALKGSIIHYERNQKAREVCLAHYGYSCHVCGMNFENVYGEIGKDFIHVHHVDFISSFKGMAHEIKATEGLIPVCPNCHAMLHRKINGKYLSPEELKTIISK